MVDNRIFEKQARELLANYNTIYFYIVTNKKNLIERKIQKVSDTGVYSDIYTRYRARFHDDININNELSIISDPYAMNSFHAMRYAEFMGTKWKITNVEVQYPRLLLTLGVKYNAEQA